MKIEAVAQCFMLVHELRVRSKTSTDDKNYIRFQAESNYTLYLASFIPDYMVPTANLTVCTAIHYTCDLIVCHEFQLLCILMYIG